MRLPASMAILILLSGCTPILKVTAEPADARILYSSSGAQGTFIPAGRGRAEIAMEFASETPIIVRVAKDGHATQDFQYGPDDRLPRSLHVRLDTARAVESRELRRTYGGLEVVTRSVLAEVEEAERSPHSKNLARLTNFKNEELKFVQSFDVAADAGGTRIVFEVCDPEGVALWMTTAGQAGLTRLSPPASGYDTGPTFSRDGKHVLFTSTRSGSPMIWRARSTGQGGVTRITSGSSQYFDPHASSTHLVYSEFFSKERPSFLWVSNLEGALPTQLREGESPRWSPDGKRIVYLDESKVWVMDAEGGSPTQLTSGTTTEMDPSWSPDGSKIVYASDKGKDAKGRPNFDIWLMNADGTQATQLTTNGSEDVGPAWDPNGRHVYFRSNRGMGSNLWRMELAK
jgi:hypothetical protein